MKSTLFIYSLFVVFLLLVPSSSALTADQKTTPLSNCHKILLFDFGITSDGHLFLNITNIGNDTISMQTIFVHFWGGNLFFTKQNVNTYAYIHDLPPQETQIIQTQHPICRISNLFHVPFLFLAYQLELTFMEIPLHFYLKILGWKIQVQPI